MTGFVRAMGVADAPEPDPDVRAQRLTRLERLALAAVRRALDGRAPPDSLALVFATGYGGLAATAALLDSIADRGMAFGSATAFHQSVHHAAAGQLSLLLGIRGPVLTVSERELSGEAALRVGLAMLDRAGHALVVAADERTPVLDAGYRAFGRVFEASEGAAAVLLSREPGPVRVERCELVTHPASVRRFAAPARFGPALAAAVACAGPGARVWLAAPTSGVAASERSVLGPDAELVAPSTPVGFHPSAGLVRVVRAAGSLAHGTGPGATVLHGLALGGGQALTVLRRDG